MFVYQLFFDELGYLGVQFHGLDVQERETKLLGSRVRYVGTANELFSNDVGDEGHFLLQCLIERLVGFLLTDEAVSDEPGPEQQVEGMLMHARLERAWRYLEEEQRVLLMLQGIDGCSLAEIEEITGIAQGKLKSRLHRARNRLGRLLAREETATVTELRSSNDELPRHRKFAG